MKPIEIAERFRNICPHCKISTDRSSHIFACSKRDLGDYPDPCTNKDWEQCPFKDEIKNE